MCFVAFCLFQSDDNKGILTNAALVYQYYSNDKLEDKWIFGYISSLLSPGYAGSFIDENIHLSTWLKYFCSLTESKCVLVFYSSKTGDYDSILIDDNFCQCKL